LIVDRFRHGLKNEDPDGFPQKLILELVGRPLNYNFRGSYKEKLIISWAYRISPSLNDLKGFTLPNKLFKKKDGVWTNQADGKLSVVYQIEENGYNARSFEDAFIHINKGYRRQPCIFST